MEHGIVTDWNDMERVWQYIYSKDQLQVSIYRRILFFINCINRLIMVNN